MKRLLLALLFPVLGLYNFLQAQTPGFIYKPSSSVFGKSVLDPNGDGYTSANSNGFSGTDFGSNSELNMIAIPTPSSESYSDLTKG